MRTGITADTRILQNAPTAICLTTISRRITQKKAARREGYVRIRDRADPRGDPRQREDKGNCQSNRIHCHETTAETVVMGAQPFDRYCWDCHRNVAHGTRGASSLPYQDSTLYPTK